MASQENTKILPKFEDQLVLKRLTVFTNDIIGSKMLDQITHQHSYICKYKNAKHFGVNILKSSSWSKRYEIRQLIGDSFY